MITPAAPVLPPERETIPLGIALSLRYAGTAVHTPAAWFIAGSDPQTWLEELTRWNVPLGDARIYLLPTSSTDRRTAGVLVTLPGSCEPRADAIVRAEAFGCVGGVLFLPVTARLYPETTVAELQAALAYNVCVLHPSIGLAGFKFSDAVAIAALLEKPRRRRGVWNRARPGAAPHSRLVSVEPEAIETLEMMLDAARGDIGTQAHLPPPNDRADAQSGGMMERLAAGMSRLFGPLMGGGNGAHDGTPRRSTLEDTRNKEVDRLLEMLEKDPDEGLRYAIPFGGAGARGIARPGRQLTAHTVDFRFSRIRGGGAADYWPIPPEIQAQLRKKYLEAANRELRLGRHRRAAYIFAELLGDHSAAATALKQGRHYREAALVYRDMLKNTILAAECLESGGLIVEAIALREEMMQWLEAARLYEILDQKDSARNAYRRAADAELAQHNITGAVTILLEKLDDSDTALQLLESAWPSSDQARECLKERFALLGRLGRHAAAGKLIQSLRTQDLSHEQCQSAIEVLAETHAKYPDLPQRAKAADTARVLAGTRLPRVMIDRARELTASITALALDDRLLARDGQRYIEQWRVEERATVKAPAGRKALVKGRFRLPGASWKSVASATGAIFYAIGTAAAGETAFLRGVWSGETQMNGWAVRPRHPLRLEVPHQASLPVIVAICTTDAPPHNDRPQTLPLRKLSENRHFTERAIIGTPPWLPPQLAGFCYDEHGAVYSVTLRHGEATLSHFSSDAALLAQFTMERLEPGRTGQWLPMAARNDCVFASNGGSRLIAFFRGSQNAIEMPRAIHALAVTSPFTRPRVAVALEDGGMLLWPTPPKRTPQCHFGEGMQHPAVAFTRGGALVAATKDEVRIYSTEKETLRILSNSPGPGAPPIAVVPAEQLNEFALFMENGEVIVYQVP